MLFDRYRSSSKSKTTTEDTSTTTTTKKSSLANALFRKFPLHLSSSKKKTSKNNITFQPRPSLSLPNINTIIPSTTPQQQQPIPMKSITTIVVKQRNRHSAEQRRRHNHQAHLKENVVVARHSFTFGHLTSKSLITRADLTLDSNQLLKLSRLVSLKDDTEFLLSQLGNTTSTTPLIPHRSISHQQLTPMNRTHSESFHPTTTSNNPLEPKELFDLLQQQNKQLVTLIDVRNLQDYQKKRIRASFNVNLPSLLIKRYQRGTVANFNLENFITTVEGRELYVSTHLQSKLGSTLLEQKAVQAELKKKQKSTIWVVYDESMSTTHSQQAWTLLNVLERCIGGKFYYLKGGYNAFQQEYQEWIESSLQTSTSDHNNNSTILNIPRRSISYTMGDSKNDLYKRTSLFSLDTQAARVNNANALARRAKRRSQQNVPTTTINTTTTTTTNPPIHIMPTSSILAPFFPPPPPPPPPLLLPHPSFSNQLILNRVTEDDDDEELTEIMTSDGESPRTESDFRFIISEIIPGFLFVGPEIETLDHAHQLHVRHVKRVLNMAEECLDEGLNKEKMIYHKISARDTLEMKNVQLVMMEAVQFIEEAKKNHEPIYVHCKAGKSRSITAILAYLVTSERWTLKRAYRHVINARPTMSPNIGFISELMKMEGRVHGRVGSFLETDWQSTSLPSPEYENELVQLKKTWAA